MCEEYMCVNVWRLYVCECVKSVCACVRKKETVCTCVFVARGCV